MPGSQPSIDAGVGTLRMSGIACADALEVGEGIGAGVVETADDDGAQDSAKNVALTATKNAR